MLMARDATTAMLEIDIGAVPRQRFRQIRLNEIVPAEVADWPIYVKVPTQPNPVLGAVGLDHAVLAGAPLAAVEHFGQQFPHCLTVLGLDEVDPGIGRAYDRNGDAVMVHESQLAAHLVEFAADRSAGRGTRSPKNARLARDLDV